MKTININNKVFKLKGELTRIEYSRELARFKTLKDCYNKPSKAKQEIYKHWLDFFVSNGGGMGIISYNTNMFTIGGFVIIEGETYYIYITKTRQEIYKVFG